MSSVRAGSEVSFPVFIWSFRVNGISDRSKASKCQLVSA